MPVPLAARIATVSVVIIPFLGVLAAIIMSWNRGVSWVELGLLVSMYILTVLGITVGYHRLFTHRAFETNRFIQCILVILGSMAVQGPLIKWVAFHRRHHQHSDAQGDPHTPNLQGKGVAGVLRGAFYAHIGWFFDPVPADLYACVKDIRKDPFLCKLSALFPLWIVIGLLIPAVIGGLITMSWTGALMGLIWGGLVRIFLVHHVTWSINSVCHLWGRRPFGTRDFSRNNALFGILGLGEGWHNNHHAFPVSARHGLKWWQIDVGYYTIRMLALFKLAWNVRLPAAVSR